MKKRTLIAAGVLTFVVIAFIAFVVGKKSVGGSATAISGSAQDFYGKAISLEEKNEFLEARDLYQKIVTEHSDFKDIAEAQKKLENLNIKIIFSAIEDSQTTTHQVQEGDSLGKIAKKYNTTMELIKKSNGLTKDTVKLGQRLRIWTGVFSVFVDKSQNILILKSNGEVIKIYTVATGANNSTPVGTFKIVNKLVDPVWFKSGAIIPPESTENVLGSRWMGFDIPGYGIHGTTDPVTIGQQITAGCVRMVNKDVEELYDLLSVGTQVTVVN